MIKYKIIATYINDIIICLYKIKYLCINTNSQIMEMDDHGISNTAKMMMFIVLYMLLMGAIVLTSGIVKV